MRQIVVIKAAAEPVSSRWRVTGTVSCTMGCSCTCSSVNPPVVMHVSLTRQQLFLVTLAYTVAPLLAAQQLEASRTEAGLPLSTHSSQTQDRLIATARCVRQAPVTVAPQHPVAHLPKFSPQQNAKFLAWTAHLRLHQAVRSVPLL